MGFVRRVSRFRRRLRCVRRSESGWAVWVKCAVGAVADELVCEGFDEAGCFFEAVAAGATAEIEVLDSGYGADELGSVRGTVMTSVQASTTSASVIGGSRFANLSCRRR